ncbi:MAG: sulfotransferase [Planctomycetota bacterium]
MKSRIGELKSFVAGKSAAATLPEPFHTVERFCVFIGHPRTGSTLVGSIIDAHPDAVMSHELLAPKLLMKEQKPTREVFEMILENSASSGRSDGKRFGNGYKYSVPEGWHGRHRAIRVIGDKNAGKTTRFLGIAPPEAREAGRAPRIDRLRRRVGMPLRIVQVARRPEDTVTSIMRKTKRHPGPDEAIEIFLELSRINRRLRDNTPSKELHLVRLEELIADPAGGIRSMLAFLGLEQDEAFINNAASIVFRKPSKAGSGEGVSTSAELKPEEVERELTLTPEHSERIAEALGDDPAYAPYLNGTIALPA